MTVESALRDVSGVLLDTAPVIYHLEGNPRYANTMTRFFRTCATRNIELYTTPITLLECLVHPLRRGLSGLAESYRDLLTAGERTRFCPIGTAEAQRAAELRAQHNLLLADALQAATAEIVGPVPILTNDPVFRRAGRLRVLVLDELE